MHVIIPYCMDWAFKAIAVSMEEQVYCEMPQIHNSLTELDNTKLISTLGTEFYICTGESSIPHPPPPPLLQFCMEEHNIIDSAVATT